jgi:hypothetical protein
MLENELQKLTLQLRKAQEDISDLVQMHTEAISDCGSTPFLNQRAKGKRRLFVNGKAALFWLLLYSRKSEVFDLCFSEQYCSPCGGASLPPQCRWWMGDHARDQSEGLMVGAAFGESQVRRPDGSIHGVNCDQTSSGAR